MGVAISNLVFSILLAIPFHIVPVAAPARFDRPPITALAMVPGSRESVVAASQAGVFLIEPGAEWRAAFATELENVHHLAFSPDGEFLAVAGGSPAESGAVEIWSWSERKRIGELVGHSDVVYAVEWLRDGSTVVTGSADHSIRVWDSETKAVRATLKGHSGPVLALALSGDGKLLCSGSDDHTIRVWDTNQWQFVRSLTNHLGPVRSLSFPMKNAVSESPEWLASAGADRTVRIWQPDTGRMLRIIRHDAPVNCVAYDSAGRLYSGAQDGRLRVIDADLGQVTREFRVSRGWLLAITQNTPQSVVTGDSLGTVQVTSVNR